LPRITGHEDFDGFEEKLARLGLRDLYDQAESTLNFPLLVAPQRFANGTQGIRQDIDQRFATIPGWVNVRSGGVDWTASNSAGASLAVEVQVSGRSDLLAIDVLHLRDEMRMGRVDVGVIIVPDDRLSRYLTDRTPNFRTALRHVSNNAAELPIRVLAFSHDGEGPALPKIVTNLGSGGGSIG
jgi:hypothetical protein